MMTPMELRNERWAPAIVKKLQNRGFTACYVRTRKEALEPVSYTHLLAVLVIFSVIARYFFSHSWKQLAEFNVTLFAFTTFWGMGINVLKNEHVMIDILYDAVKPAIKRWLSVVNYLIVLVVVLVFTYQGYKYVGVAGKQISQGMEIPMKYMYGIMPVCGAICAVCVVIKIIEFITVDVSYFAPKNKALTDDAPQRCV